MLKAGRSILRGVPYLVLNNPSRAIGLAIGLFFTPCMAVAVSSRILLKVPFYPDKTDQCGPATLAEVLTFWGKPVQPEQLRKDMYLAKLHGTLPMDLLLTAKERGLKTEMARGTVELLKNELQAGRPVLVMLNAGTTSVPFNHYVVIVGMNEERQGFFAHSAGQANRFIPYRN